MYLIFNKLNGSNFAHLPKDGILRTITNGNMVMDTATLNALDNLKAGEYVYYGHYVIVRSGGGVTLDELKAR